MKAPLSDGERIDLELITSRSALFRLWLGCKLMGLAGRVLGCPIRIRIQEPEETPPPG